MTFGLPQIHFGALGFEKHKTKHSKYTKQNIRKTQNKTFEKAQTELHKRRNSGTIQSKGKVYTMDYVRRIVDDELDRKAEAFNAINIVGPKGCGKTRTAKERCKTIIEFQDEEKRD